ncbi:MAG: bifunctional glutamate N-acetyltransferase/amino-acid acetyltransferase ArgJ [Candidatus Omnitrophica bacterium]|nr:bifunctional glutamate N-acetyltransferase/amino-acid acetyltransferase ArgJ [Candidatus Omnitrophota bacterium]
MNTIKVKKHKGAITYPRGFLASGLYCGIKKNKNKKDLALVYSVVPAVAAACFTRNRITAWPVKYSKKVISNTYHRAIITNSGNANCYTSAKGKETVDETIAFLAKELGISKKEILVCSTGIIGKVLDPLLIVSSIPELCFNISPKGGDDAAAAMLTTDTVTKQVIGQCNIGGKQVRIGAMAKGVGMMKPNMATMLAYITTDCAISKNILQRAIREIVDETFNAISVDNDTSTNDTVFIMANGLAKNPKITGAGKGLDAFKKTLFNVCRELASMMVHDGEGTSRVCLVTMKGAKTQQQAKEGAQAIADSMLFKTALAGADPNWGRIVAAIGAKRSVACNVEKLDLKFGPVSIIRNGTLLNYDKKRAKFEFSKKDVEITVDLKSGRATTQFLTSDLTKKYVEINAEYTT